MKSKKSVKGLGRLEFTILRHYEFIGFKDGWARSCSLQASDLPGHAKAGTTAIWLGCDNIHEHVGPFARMHLTRKQVKSLVAHLQKWLSDHTFKL